MKPENPVTKNDIKRLGDKFQTFFFVLLLMMFLLYVQGKYLTGPMDYPATPAELSTLDERTRDGLLPFADGDVIFQETEGELPDVISAVTGSPLNHCGLIMLEGEDVLVIEAVGQVSKTPLTRWIRRGRESRFALLKAKGLSDSARARIVESAAEFMNRPYDFHYRMDNERIYCSELVFKAYLKGAGIRLSEPQKLKELKYRGHEKFIEKLVEGPVPLEREIITPVRIYNSPFLKKAYDDFKEPEMK